MHKDAQKLFFFTNFLHVLVLALTCRAPAIMAETFHAKKSRRKRQYIFYAALCVLFTLT